MVTKSPVQNGAYRTPDIHLAAFLLTKKYSSLVEIDTSSKRRSVFVFDPPPSEEQIESFYDRHESALVMARDIMEELRTLKSRIMGQRG